MSTWKLIELLISWLPVLTTGASSLSEAKTAVAFVAPGVAFAVQFHPSWPSVVRAHAVRLDTGDELSVLVTQVDGTTIAVQFEGGLVALDII